MPTTRARCSGASGSASIPGSFRKAASSTARRRSRRCIASSRKRSACKREHVKLVGRTRDWLRYEVPENWIKREWRGSYRGQKQIWFLLRLVGRDTDISLRASTHPEFDAWRWHEYWVPLDAVIEFKRDVYSRALTELSRYLTRKPEHTRYLRQHTRAPLRNLGESPAQSRPDRKSGAH